MFDLTYTPFIHQHVLVITKKYILKNRPEVSRTFRAKVSGHFGPKKLGAKYPVTLKSRWGRKLQFSDRGDYGC